LSLWKIYSSLPNRYSISDSKYLENIGNYKGVSELVTSTYSSITINSLDNFSFSIYSFTDRIDFTVTSKMDTKEDEVRFLLDSLELPGVAYYQTDRRVSPTPSLQSKSLKKLNSSEYNQSISEVINFDYFFEWFRNTEDYENEQRLHFNSNYRDSSLEAFRRALSIFLPDYKNPRIQRQPKERLVVNGNDCVLSINQLSHGEKLIFAMIGDLIRCMSRQMSAFDDETNPSLKKGIVLIDEIEQHLHPSWQRTIIPNLRKTFPNIQFIITTHSPQVLSNVPKENVFILEDFKLVEKTPPTFGRDSNSILYDLFGVEERPEKAKEEFQKLYKLIDDPDAEELAKSMLNEMEIKYGTEDAEIVRAKLHLEFLTR